MKFFKKEYEYNSNKVIPTVTQVEGYIKSKTNMKFEISKSELCEGIGKVIPALQKVNIFKLNFTVMHV